MNTEKMISERQPSLRQIICRECKRLIEVPSSIVEGQNVRCAYCFKKFAFSETSCVKENVDGRPEDVNTMAIRCSECRRMVLVPPTVKEGQYVLCPHCSTKFCFKFGATMQIPSIDLSFLRKGSLTIKCDLCKEYIVVDDNIVVGQHVLCPFCKRKFSYRGEDMEPKPHAEKKVVDGKTSKKTEDEKKGTKKKKMGRIASQYRGKIADREWVKSTITRSLAVAGAFAFAVVLAVLYVQYHAEIDTRIELRNTLAEFIRSNHQMLQDRYSQYSLAIRNCRNDMWNSRGKSEEMRLLRERVDSLLRVQSAIDEVERMFASVAPRLDEMDVGEIKKTQQDLSVRISRISSRFENTEVDPLASLKVPERRVVTVVAEDIEPKTTPYASATVPRIVVEPRRPIEVRNAQPVPRTEKRSKVRQSVDNTARLQDQIDKIVIELKDANYPFDMSSLDGRSIEEKLSILVEMRDDVRMQKKRK